MHDGKLVGIAAESQWYRAMLLVLIACCTYLHVPLVSGGRLLVPSFPTVALIPLLFLAVRRNFSTADLFFLPKIAFVLLLSIALSPGYAYIQQKFLAMAQFLLALAVAVLIVRLMQQLSRATLERTLLVLWCLIVGGAVLEVLEVIRVPSDSFREWAYGGTYTLYDANLRDLNLVGWSRPKLFSSEPSHVTKFFIASINSWLLVKVTGRKAAVVAAATVAMLVIMGSPMLLVSAAITLAILLWNQRARLSSRVMTVAAVLLLGAFVVAYYAEPTYTNVVSRVAKVGESPTSVERGLSSEERRMIIPYLALADTWLRWPLFGTGVGGKEVVGDAKGTNALADFGIFLGIVGAAWFMFLLFGHARKTGVHRRWLLLALLVLFSQLMGGIDTFRYWGFVALLWGALAVADSATDPGPRPADGKS